jgi:hypothetical protein
MVGDRLKDVSMSAGAFEFKSVATVMMKQAQTWCDLAIKLEIKYKCHDRLF